MNTLEIELDELCKVQKELDEVYKNLTHLCEATMYDKQVNNADTKWLLPN